MFEDVIIDGKNHAMILRANYHSNGVTFFTPSSFSQQLGYMHHPKGHIIAAHSHNLITREVQLTNEVLFVRSGKVRVDFYDNDNRYLESRVLSQGDVIHLISGGHGFEMLQDSEIIEVKQGPFIGDKDKTVFLPDKAKL